MGKTCADLRIKVLTDVCNGLLCDATPYNFEGMYDYLAIDVYLRNYTASCLTGLQSLCAICFTPEIKHLLLLCSTKHALIGLQHAVLGVAKDRKVAQSYT
jgi:hypothetical protein